MNTLIIKLTLLLHFFHLSDKKNDQRFNLIFFFIEQNFADTQKMKTIKKKLILNYLKKKLIMNLFTFFLITYILYVYSF